MRRAVTGYISVALLFLGSATLLFSCQEQSAPVDRRGETTMMTEFSENLSIVMSENGRRSYFFETPQLEGYTLATEPYREFRRGIKITTYQDDSLTTVDAVLTANYAIYYEERGLWEARSNVEVHKTDGTEVYTQQLFWNTRTKKVYSNVDTKLIQGNNVTIGESFESDEQFTDWRFRYQKSRMEVNVTPSEGDTTVQQAPPTVVAAEPITYGERSKARQRPTNTAVQERPAPRPSDQHPQAPHHNPSRNPNRIESDAALHPLATPKAELKAEPKSDRLQLRKSDVNATPDAPKQEVELRQVNQKNR